MWKPFSMPVFLFVLTFILICDPLTAQESQTKAVGSNIARELDRLKALSESELADKGLDIAKSIQLTLGKKRELARLQSRIDAESATLQRIQKQLEISEKAFRDRITELQNIYQMNTSVDLSDEVASLRSEKSRISSLQGFVRAIEGRLLDDNNRKNIVIAQVNSPTKARLVELPAVPAEMLGDNTKERTPAGTSNSDASWLESEFQAIQAKGGK